MKIKNGPKWAENAALVLKRAPNEAESTPGSFGTVRPQKGNTPVFDSKITKHTNNENSEIWKPACALRSHLESFLEATSLKTPRANTVQ